MWTLAAKARPPECSPPFLGSEGTMRRLQPRPAMVACASATASAATPTSWPTTMSAAHCLMNLTKRRQQ
eukprot:5086980-Lingulodinium_polyedra.AAC.1